MRGDLFIHAVGLRESYRHLIWALMKGAGKVGRDRSLAPGGGPPGV